MQVDSILGLLKDIQLNGTNIYCMCESKHTVHLLLYNISQKQRRVLNKHRCKSVRVDFET